MIESLVGFAALLALAFAGLPLAFSMLLVGTVGFMIERNLGAAYSMMGQQILDFSTNYSLTVLPLFVLMGTFIHHAKMSEELYDSANAWLGHRRGGLRSAGWPSAPRLAQRRAAMATVAACAGFAAVSGSSLATAATMSKVAMPAMRRFKSTAPPASGFDRRSTAATARSRASCGASAASVPGRLSQGFHHRTRSRRNAWYPHSPTSVPMVIYGILTDHEQGGDAGHAPLQIR